MCGAREWVLGSPCEGRDSAGSLSGSVGILGVSGWYVIPGMGSSWGVFCMETGLPAMTLSALGMGVDDVLMWLVLSSEEAARRLSHCQNPST